MPAPINQFAEDQFTDTAGVNLESHTPILGTAWTRVAGMDALVISDANRCRRGAGSTNPSIYTIGTPPGANYAVQSGLYPFTHITQDVSILLRYVSLSAYVFLYHDDVSTPSNRIIAWYRFDSGSPVLLTSTAYDAGTGSEITLQGQVTGTGSTVSLAGYINDSLMLSVDDSSASRLTSAGTTGYFFSTQPAGGNAAGHHVDNFIAGDIPLVSTTTYFFYNIINWIDFF